MTFLPQNYKAPSSNNNYMKLQEGENKLRILSAPIMGWEEWVDKKPIRYPMDKKPNKPFDSKNPIRHFWAFIVWNYAEEQIQILQITQATIRSCLEALCKDEDWGEPFGYDIKIIKRGEGTDTEYMVNPLPGKPLDQKIIDAFNKKRCYLDALYTNEEPFSMWDYYTPAFFTVEEDVEDVLKDCPESYQKMVSEFVERQHVKSLKELPKVAFDKIRIEALKEREINRNGARNG